MPILTPTAPPTSPATGALSLTELMGQAQALQHAGQPQAAAALYQQWLAEVGKVPLRHAALFNWGTLLSTLQREQEAEAAYREALELQPDFVHALLNMGHVLERRGATDEALAHWQRVVDSDAAPDLRMHALNNQGRLLETLRRYPEAEDCLRKSLLLQPRQTDVVQHYVHLRQKQCKWPAHEPVGEVTPNQLLTGTSLLAMMSASDDPALQLMAAQRFCYEKVPKPPAVALHTLMPKRTGRIKIGYLSGDLHTHAVGLLTPELLELHDRSKFEVYGFCWTPESTPRTAAACWPRWITMCAWRVSMTKPLPS